MQFPKPKTVRLGKKEYAKFRLEVFLRENGICQGCGKFVPVLMEYGGFDPYFCGHVSHTKSRGAGGGDTPDNVKWMCFECHRREHNGRSK